MGFLDKAKQMAEQAQQKIDDAQKQFNESQAQKGAQAGQVAPAQRFDQHGRPVAAADSGTPPNSPPPQDTPDAEPAVPEQAQENVESVEDPAAEPPPGQRDQPEPADGPGGQANANPDPFKPIGG